MDVESLEENLIEKLVSYAFTLDFGDADDKCSSHPIYDEEFFLVLPANRRLAQQPSITRVNLGDEVFLIPRTESPKLAR